MKKILVGIGLVFFINSAFASDWVAIDDMSKLKYQIFQNRVYLRNVNEFDSTWLSSCCAYYVDLTTDEGKAMWSTMLAKIAMASKYNIGVENKSVNGSRVTYSGNW